MQSMAKAVDVVGAGAVVVTAVTVVVEAAVAVRTGIAPLARCTSLLPLLFPLSSPIPYLFHHH